MSSLNNNQFTSHRFKIVKLKNKDGSVKSGHVKSCCGAEASRDMVTGVWYTHQAPTDFGTYSQIRPALEEHHNKRKG